MPGVYFIERFVAALCNTILDLLKIKLYHYESILDTLQIPLCVDLLCYHALNYSVALNGSCS